VRSNFFFLLDDDYYNNAKLAISIARKLGATIFLVPEDIVEVRAKMVSVVWYEDDDVQRYEILIIFFFLSSLLQNLTFVGSLMLVDRQMQH
jgi:plastin-1